MKCFVQIPRWLTVFGRFVTVGALLLIAVPPTHALQINDSSLNFSITIPDEFEPFPEMSSAKPDIVYAYRKGSAVENSQFIMIERMHGTIGKEHLEAKRLPPGFSGRIFTLPWQGFEIEAVELPEQAQGIDMINYNVQVPLKGQAIQLRVAGPAASKDRLLAMTNSLLASLQGQSNWLSSSMPGSIAQSGYYGPALLTIMAIVIIGGHALLWRLSRVDRRLLPAVSTGMYALSYCIDPGRSRELIGLVGVLRLFGFCGLILTGVDLYLHRRAQRTTERSDRA